MPVKARHSFHMQVRFIEREGLPNPLTTSSLNIDTSEYSMIFYRNPCSNVTLVDSGKGWLKAAELFPKNSSDKAKVDFEVEGWFPLSSYRGLPYDDGHAYT